MPLSRIVIVLASASTQTRISSAGASSNSPGSSSASKRSLSQASDALETSSRRKISLFEYSDEVQDLLDFGLEGVGVLAHGVVWRAVARVLGVGDSAPWSGIASCGAAKAWDGGDRRGFKSPRSPPPAFGRWPLKETPGRPKFP